MFESRHMKTKGGENIHPALIPLVRKRIIPFQILVLVCMKHH